MKYSSVALAAALVLAWSADNAAAFTTTSNTVPVTASHHQQMSTLLFASTMDESKTEQKNNEPINGSTDDSPSFADRFTNSGVASAAAMATAAVNAAVSMKTLEAPDVDKSYISLDSNAAAELDDEGLPRVYDKDLIEKYWDKERGALNRRWGEFVGKAVPFLTKLTTLFIRDGKIQDKEIPALSKQARVDLQDLGATFIKAGQMMSVRPDVLPQPTLDELAKLQDSVVPFDTTIAVEQIERELGGPLGQFFTSISEEPVAAASLAQVYLATLNDGKDTKVAVKVQRPEVLGTVSKDLYVLRRAAEVFQGLVERFAPQQRTNYVALLNEWSIGFYTELDFNNEAQNQQRLRQILIDNNIQGVVVPNVFEELCTRRILVSEWMEGKKLSECSKEQIAEVTPYAQEAFLVQLFSEGFFHADPHPGNILYLNEPTEEGHKVALIDCGLMASIGPADRDNMISAVIHLANKDYANLVDDFIKLKILPEDTNRASVIPLMDKALSPYVKGGGAKKYEEELRKLYGMEDVSNMQSQVGGFQAMTQDALTVLNDIPFSIPPYFAILGRAIVTLEGVALTGNPNYGIIMESFPFISRKLLSEDRPEIQRALQEVLYTGDNDLDDTQGLKLSRLLSLLNNAAGSTVAKEGAAFVDLDAVPEDGLSFAKGLKFILSDRAESLRRLLEPEVDTILDVLSRQLFRKAANEALIAFTPPRPPALPFLGDILPPTPKLDDIPLPFLLPSGSGDDGLGRPSVAVMTWSDLTNAVAPKLDQDEEVYAISLSDGAREFFGEDVAAFVKGEGVLSAKTAELVLTALRSGAFGRSDILSSDTAQQVVDAASSIVSQVRGSSSQTTEFSAELDAALSELNEEERAQLDSIVAELVQRGIRRVLGRLSSVNRVL
ncbi:protein kinase UbiB [Seminavis robusta]|uniref:Protein kinase UbiB n=1 Tax=Seminavis robusta TaxID=568900 RepID=A0A9N8HQ04_9STRA|nr:protein kinase UbiB [Seminavis robusta]|eukprot:Sro1384_g268150.1 protein kinase UbiB (893) ;mRNA; r:23607-26493